MLGYTRIAVCGDDAHGTTIMLKENPGLTQKLSTLTATMRLKPAKFDEAFQIVYDHYHTTHSRKSSTSQYDLLQHPNS